jgi:DUF1707 SHOCT-like domain
MDHGMRASDADRERAVQALQRHAAAGRLTLDEFSDRAHRALACRTHADLAALLRDLPAESTVDHVAGGRQLVIAFAVALAVLLVIGLAVAMFR